MLTPSHCPPPHHHHCHFAPPPSPPLSLCPPPPPSPPPSLAHIVLHLTRKGASTMGQALVPLYVPIPSPLAPSEHSHYPHHTPTPPLFSCLLRAQPLPPSHTPPLPSPLAPSEHSHYPHHTPTPPLFSCLLRAQPLPPSPTHPSPLLLPPQSSWLQSIASSGCDRRMPYSTCCWRPMVALSGPRRTAGCEGSAAPPCTGTQWHAFRSWLRLSPYRDRPGLQPRERGSGQANVTTWVGGGVGEPTSFTVEKRNR